MYVWLLLVLVALVFLVVLTTDPKVRVVVYETDPSASKPLIDSLKRNGYAYSLIGVGEPWNGWYGRVKGYHNYVKSVSPDQYIVFSDGRDVLANRPVSEFLDKATRMYRDRVIIGTEQNFWAPGVPDDVAEEIKKKDVPGEYKYPNFGLMFGKAKHFDAFFTRMDIQPGEDDQSLAIQLYHDDPSALDPDFRQELFSNAPGLNVDTCHFDTQGKQWRNTKTDTVPFFIHTSGKNQSCYNKLLGVHKG